MGRFLRQLYSGGAVLFLCCALALPAMAQVIDRVSVSSLGTEASASCWTSALSISADGNIVVFSSTARNLVIPQDSNDFEDVFVHDRDAGQTVRVSAGMTGGEANGDSRYPAVSADGRYIAFYSEASDLVAGDTNSTSDVFLYDRGTGQIARMSEASDGTQANGASGYPRISADGRYVVFRSEATNLVSGDNNGVADIFRKDRVTGEILLVSMASDGSQADGGSTFSAVSGDGQYIAFTTAASNLASDDTNDCPDVYLRDISAGTTVRVSVLTDGTQGNSESSYPAISADGRYVAFTSFASNFKPVSTDEEKHVFLRDTEGGTTTWVASEGPTIFEPDFPAFSADGRFLALQSSEPLAGLATGDKKQVYVYDRVTAQFTLMSRTSAGVVGDSFSMYPSISTTGHYVAFSSFAANLITGDTNNQADVFVSYRNAPPTADAGATMLTIISSNGTNADVTLDGSKSSDPEGDPLLYYWYWQGNLVATGNTASVSFAVGTHTIGLVAMDPDNSSDSDTITIQVLTAKQATLDLGQDVKDADVPDQLKTSLLVSTEAASAAFGRGNTIAGANSLQAFQHKVLAQRDKAIDVSTADTLCDSAQLIIDAATGTAAQ